MAPIPSIEALKFLQNNYSGVSLGFHGENKSLVDQLLDAQLIKRYDDKFTNTPCFFKKEFVPNKPLGICCPVTAYCTVKRETRRAELENVREDLEGLDIDDAI